MLKREQELIFAEPFRPQGESRIDGTRPPVARERSADLPGSPPFPRERSADAVRRHEGLLSGLVEECRALRSEIGAVEQLRYRGEFLLVQQRAIEAEFGRVAASSAAFESSVASVQQAVARVEREVQQLKERAGKQERRIQGLEVRVQLIEQGDRSSAFEQRLERVEACVERIEACALSQERRLRSCAAELGLEGVCAFQPQPKSESKKQRHQ